eukprot:jgi/Botrbrau1/18098/Bobra.0738s0003.1
MEFALETPGSVGDQGRAQSLTDLCLKVAVRTDHWRAQRRQLEGLPEEAANTLLQGLLASGRLAPPQLHLFRHCVTVLPFHVYRFTNARLQRAILAEAAHFQFLNELHLDNFSHLTGSRAPTLAVLIPLAKTLRHLSLSSCSGLGPETIPWVAQLTSLTYLSLEGTKAVPIFPGLSSLIRLRGLNLSSLALTDSCCYGLPCLSALRTLLLCFTPLSHSAFQPPPSQHLPTVAAPALTGLSQLEVLDLSSTGATLPPAVPSLTKLSLSGCSLSRRTANDEEWPGAFPSHDDPMAMASMGAESPAHSPAASPAHLVPQGGTAAPIGWVSSGGAPTHTVGGLGSHGALPQRAPRGALPAGPWRLRELDLRHTKFVHCVTARELLAGGFLTRLDLSEAKGLPDLRMLGDLTGLRHLTMRGFEVEGRGALTWPPLPALEHLEISSQHYVRKVGGQSTRLHDLGLLVNPALSMLVSCRALQQLSFLCLRGHCDPSPESLELLLRSCALRTLDLSNTCIDLKHIPRQTVDATDGSAIQGSGQHSAEDATGAVDEGLGSNLQNLSLVDCSFSDTSSSAAIAGLAPHLTSLDVGSATFCIANLNSLSRLTRLQRLFVRGDFPCSPCVMQSDVTALRRLTHLTLNRAGYAGLQTCGIPEHKPQVVRAQVEAWARRTFPCLRGLVWKNDAFQLHPDTRGAMPGDPGRYGDVSFALSDVPELLQYDERFKYSRQELLEFRGSPEVSAFAGSNCSLRTHLQSNFPSLLVA